MVRISPSPLPMEFRCGVWIEMDFYSARLVVIILVDDDKPKKRNNHDEVIIVFKAHSYEHAFERALELGRAQEHTYKNSKNQDVRWALVDVAQIHHIGPTIEDREVISQLFSRTSATPVPFNQQFEPEKRLPHET